MQMVLVFAFDPSLVGASLDDRISFSTKACESVVGHEQPRRLIGCRGRASRKVRVLAIRGVRFYCQVVVLVVEDEVDFV